MRFPDLTAPALPEDKALELVVFAAGFGEEDAAAVRNLLSATDGSGLRRQLFAVERTEGTAKVKVQVVDALFPDRVLALRNTLAAALPGGFESDLFRDGLEVLALEHLLLRRDLDAFVLLRRPADPLVALAPWRVAPARVPYLPLRLEAGPPAAFAFHNGHPQLRPFVETAAELYISGAVLALPYYSLERALQIAWDATSRVALDR